VSYLVDTNVVSELRKGRRCDPGVASWFAGVSSEEIYLSVLTVGEIRKGIENIRRRDQPAAELANRNLVTSGQDLAGVLKAF
jgi:predicted nucleic acid-binding protein